MRRQLFSVFLGHDIYGYVNRTRVEKDGMIYFVNRLPSIYLS